MFRQSASALALVATVAFTPACGDEKSQRNQPEPESLRVATFNVSLYGEESGEIKERLADPEDRQARQLAEIIQTKRPDVLLVNELDYDDEHAAAQRFSENFLQRPQGDRKSIDYPHVYAFESNTGVPSGHDLDDNGVVGTEEGTEDYANDAFGYGLFPGQYAFAVYSKYPLETEKKRTFRKFLWKDMPDSLLPRDFYTDEEIEIFRLSSKNHVDLPIEVGAHRLHLLASHPTPPAFDGDEQRNMRRNQDEIRLWHDYIRPAHAGYIYDDDGTGGGLEDDAHFVIAGDLNADPNDNDEAGAVANLLDDPRTTDPKPSSRGGAIAGETSRGADNDHQGEDKYVTTDWHEGVGNMRVDYAIPSSNLETEDSGVFWPAPDEPGAELVEATDHRLVWVDITVGVD